MSAPLCARCCAAPSFRGAEGGYCDACWASMPTVLRRPDCGHCDGHGSIVEYSRGGQDEYECGCDHCGGTGINESAEPEAHVDDDAIPAWLAEGRAMRGAA